MSSSDGSIDEVERGRGDFDIDRRKGGNLLSETTDLTRTMDSSLIGVIGEIVAWKYLRSGRIWAHRIGGWYPFPACYPFHTGKPRYVFRGLSQRQNEYLKNSYLHGPRRYDFIGVKRRCLAPGFVGDVEEAYLVEVKTTHSKSVRYSLRGGLKGKIPSDVEKAKAAGFRVLLIIVTLLKDWKCDIVCREL